MTTEAETGRAHRRPHRPPVGVRLYKVEEAAYLLRMSITSIRRVVAAGTLPYRRTPAGMRFSDADLESYIAAVAECRGDNPAGASRRRRRAPTLDIDPRVADDWRRGKGR